MTAIPLILEEGFEQRRGWNYTLMRLLASSGLFRVRTAPRRSPSRPHRRNANFSVIQVGEEMVGIDTWDTANPLSEILQNGDFHPGGAFEDLSLIFKIQMSSSVHWQAFERKCPIPVSPWTIFPNGVFPLSHFRWENQDHKYLASFTGRHQHRSGRGKWIRFFREHLPTINIEPSVTLPSWLELNKQCRWGLILHGKMSGGDGKNRRESEYLSCGMPLVLNYKPHYPFPMEPGKHYVYVERPSAMLELEGIDPKPFAEASVELYEKYFTSLGASRLFLRLIIEKSRRVKIPGCSSPKRLDSLFA